MSLNPNIFREYDIRGLVGPDLNTRTVEQLSTAIAHFFSKNGAKRIAVGFDARESSPAFAGLLAGALERSGCDAVLIGRVPTPVLYHAVYTKDVAGGVMITGSHNPADHNGFKICLGRQTLFGPQIAEIRDIAMENLSTYGSGSISHIEVLDDYKKDMADRLAFGERKLKAVVDAGNGMGGITAVPIYRALGVDLVELYTEPDSSFPNHHPDPTVEENLTDAVKAVNEHEADIGIAFDGDGDRIGVIDEKGRIIWGDELMVLLSRAVLKDNPGIPVIGEVKCSEVLFSDIKRNGGKPVMWKAGHSLIKAKMKETGALLAGEMSGHIFFADRYYGFDDAAYAGARVLEILSKSDRSLSQLLGDLPKTFSTPELRIPCSDENKFDVVKAVSEEFSESNEVITIDGARIKFDGGWGLVRASNTQAILVLRFEAQSEERLEEIRDLVESKLKAITG